MRAGGQMHDLKEQRPLKRNCDPHQGVKPQQLREEALSKCLLNTECTYLKRSQPYSHY